MYTWRGKTLDGHYRYIQYRFNDTKGLAKPIIQTKFGYSAYNVVVFETKEEAENFLEKFATSKRRRQQYYVVWDLVEYKPRLSGGKENFDEFIDSVATVYGVAHKIRYRYNAEKAEHNKKVAEEANSNNRVEERSFSVDSIEKLVEVIDTVKNNPFSHLYDVKIKNIEVNLVYIIK